MGVVLASLAVGLLIVAPGAVMARTEIATLDGEVISPAQAADLHCHDFDYPRIRCFVSSEEMLADIGVAASAELDAANLTALAGFMVVYADPAYAGASRTLSVDYPNLGSLGWNDRISSFKSYGVTGNFREHSPAGGFTYTFGSSSQVSSLSSTYNDKFSAYYVN
jgi:hypothetical protein